ncbi:hypothetical protein SLA2020_500270 [Shorea laevis]
MVILRKGFRGIEEEQDGVIRELVFDFGVEKLMSLWQNISEFANFALQLGHRVVVVDSHSVLFAASFYCQR